MGLTIITGSWYSLCMEIQRNKNIVLYSSPSYNDHPSYTML